MCVRWGRVLTVSMCHCARLTYAGVEICDKAARANDTSGRAFRRTGVTLRRAECLFRRRSNASVSSAGRRSRVDGRWSRVAGCGSFARAPHCHRVERLLRRRSGGVARLPCRQYFQTTTVSDAWPHVLRSKSCPYIWTTMRFCRSGASLTVVTRSVYYVDVLAVWHVSRVVSGIRANTISDVWFHVDRRELWRVSRGTACSTTWGTSRAH